MSDASDFGDAYSEWDERLGALLTNEASYLHDRFLEVVATGTTTIRQQDGIWTATFQPSRWRDGWLSSEGTRPDGQGTSGRTRIARKSTREQLESAITLDIGIGMLWLREP